MNEIAASPIPSVALAAAVIGLVVRMLKADVKFLPTIPPRARPWVALALGLVSTVLLHLRPGVPWGQAVIEGLTAGIIAIAGHELAVESARDGKELGWPDDKSPPAAPTLVALLFASSLVLSGCAGGLQPREQARAAVLMIGEATTRADEACAKVGAVTKNEAALKTCADSYDTARASLEGAEAFVDAWDAVTAKKLGCVIDSAVRALSSISSAASAAGATVPSIVDDAIRLASIFTGGQCK